MARLTVVVPFGDLDAVERALLDAPRRDRRDDHRARDDEHRHHPAAAAATSPGSHELLHRHGALLTFDEVKTGFATAPGGIDRALRRRARPRVPRQGAGRRACRAARSVARTEIMQPHRRRHATSRSARSTATRSRWRRPRDAAREYSRRTRTAHLDTLREAAWCSGCERHARRYRLPGYVTRVRRQGCGRLRRAAAQLPRLPRLRRRDGVTHTGCTSTTTVSSCRRGVSASSGRCRCSTRWTTLTALWRTSNVCPRAS